MMYVARRLGAHWQDAFDRLLGLYRLVPDRSCPTRVIWARRPGCTGGSPRVIHGLIKPIRTMYVGLKGLVCLIRPKDLLEPCGSVMVRAHCSGHYTAVYTSNRCEDVYFLLFSPSTTSIAIPPPCTATKYHHPCALHCPFISPINGHQHFCTSSLLTPSSFSRSETAPFHSWN